LALKARATRLTEFANLMKKVDPATIWRMAP
jgi:hypothetical protein